MQNVLDGMTKCGTEEHLRNEIVQATGWRPE
jgi:hypothetical protein